MNPDDLQDELRPEYDFDFSKAVRGKYYKQHAYPVDSGRHHGWCAAMSGVPLRRSVQL
ncbi:hypothetical protein [uncultured Lamprocystis sp.]|uniref:hypothetical protein n=1 Tax=uncultured Lamprocystis sp. TaxID=543132 RepID=UPI0025FCDBE3|nr:hypothetical protein [uncultured Lamprocystis sp.]